MNTNHPSVTRRLPGVLNKQQRALTEKSPELNDQVTGINQKTPVLTGSYHRSPELNGAFTGISFLPAVANKTRRVTVGSLWQE
ncbi:MAG: hypothetical protein ABIQ39_13280 [Ilumatobacteraceae bacterium]